MVQKTIVLKLADRDNKNKTFQLASQATFDNLLRQYQVEKLLEQNEYACEVSEYHALQEGGTYQLGETFTASVELGVMGSSSSTRQK